MLHELEILEYLIKLIKNLYSESATVIKIENISSEEFYPQKGVWEACMLSPILLNTYGEYILRNTLSK